MLPILADIGDDMAIAHGVVAHLSRYDMATDLALYLGADVLSFDFEEQGEQWNHQHVLECLYQTGADWLTLIEDDAILCTDFLDREFHALEGLKPDHLVSWYLGTGQWAHEYSVLQKKFLGRKIKEAEDKGYEFIEGNRLWHVVAFSVPRRYAIGVLKAMRSSRESTDWAIGEWCTATKTKVLYEYPSLVDHRDDDSILGNGSGAPRKAWRFAG